MTGRSSATGQVARIGGYAWTGITIAAAAVGAAVFSAIFGATPPEAYPDLIAGRLAVTGAGKAADLWGVPLAIVAALAAGFLFRRTALCLARLADERGAALRSYGSQLMLACVPAAFATGSLIDRLAADAALFRLSAAAVLLVSAIVALGARRGYVAPRIAGYAGLGVALVALLPAEASVVVDRVGGPGAIGGGRVVEAFVVLYALGAAFMLAAAVRAPGRVASLATQAILLGSLGLPAAFALLFPGPFALTSGEEFRYPATPALAAVAIALAAWAWWDLGRRAVCAASAAGRDPASAISPPAMLALVVALRYGQTLSPIVPADDFHFGEQLLGWWTALRHGAMPYVDSVPLHGLLEDDSAGYLSVLFFDGTAATIVQSGRLEHALLALLACAAMWRVMGSATIALCAAVSLGGRGAWYLLAPLFCLTADRSLRQRPDRWLAVWILAAPLVVLAAPAPGLAALASTAPVAAFAGYRAWRAGTLRLRSWPVLAAGAVVALAAATPVGGMLKGALRVVLEFGQVNRVAYGVPWRASLDSTMAPSFAAELVRMTWIVVPVVAAASLALFRRDDPGRGRVVATALPPLLFVLAMIPYAMGRIDPGSLSRPGILAVFGWSVLLLLNGRVVLGPRAIPSLVLVVALGSAAVGAGPTLTPFLRTADVRLIGAEPRAAVDAGLPAMGQGTTDAAHRQRILKVKRELDARLPPGKPYLDLTDRTAQYFYVERPPPLRIPATYNLVSASEQRRAVAGLARDPPQLALLWADNFDVDDIRLALRAPLIYRFALETYKPYEHDGLVFGELRGGARAAGSRGEGELALLDRVFANRDLGWIPVSWGRSAAGLEDRMIPVQPALGDEPVALHDVVSEGTSYRVAGADPFVVYDLSPRAIAAASAGLLRFDFTCVRPPPTAGALPVTPRLQVFFWGDAQVRATERASFYLNAADGVHIVPLDAYPRYLDLERVHGIRIDLDNPAACAAFTIRNLGLFQRVGLTVDGASSRAPHPR